MTSRASAEHASASGKCKRRTTNLHTTILAPRCHSTDTYRSTCDELEHFKCRIKMYISFVLSSVSSGTAGASVFFVGGACRIPPGLTASLRARPRLVESASGDCKGGHN
eukprot:2473845-Pleurochrysis_carterae.AAC.2